MSGCGVRREKAALSSGCKPHPAHAPAGSNRSSYGGDEVAEAFGQRVRNWCGASVQAATRVNAEQALYEAFSVKLNFRSRAPQLISSGTTNRSEGSLPSGADQRAATLYSVGR